MMLDELAKVARSIHELMATEGLDSNIHNELSDIHAELQDAIGTLLERETVRCK